MNFYRLVFIFILFIYFIHFILFLFYHLRKNSNLFINIFKRNFFTKCEAIQTSQMSENVVIIVFDKTSCQTRTIVLKNYLNFIVLEPQKFSLHAFFLIQ